MSRGLYLPNGEFREFAAEAAPRRQEMLAEIATREAAGVDLAGWLGVLPDPDPVLRKRGDSAEILTELTGDDQVFMALQDRKSKTLDREWRLTPGAPAGEQPTPAAEQLCKNFARDLEDLDLHALMSELLDAPYFGLTVAELMWAPDGGRMRLTAVTPKPRPWFGFSGDDNHLVFLRLGTWPGEPCSPFKFLAARHFPSFDNPYGSRALSRCLWPVAFKRGGWQFWMNFLEKFGQPWTVATAPDNTDRAKRRDIAADLAAMVQDAVAVLPYGAEVDLKESSGKAGDAHRQLINQCDASIAKVLLGQTLTSDSGDKGSRALGTVHYQVLAGLQNSDARLVRTFFEDLGWIYGRVNAGPDVLTPCWEWVEPEDYAARADLDGKLKGLGVRFRKPYYVRAYGLAEEDFDLEGGGEAEALPAGDHAAFVASSGDPAQAAVDSLADGLADEAAAAIQSNAREIQDAINKAESYEDLMILLAELLGRDMDTDDLADVAHRAMLNAALHGTASARGDGNG